MAGRKLKCLTFEEKFQVIKRKENGVPKKEIMREFGLSKACYYRILKEEAKIVGFLSSYEFKKKKRNKTSPYFLIEFALIKWFMQERDMGCSVNSAILQEKALIFNKGLNGPETFGASAGWLYKFQWRYGIKLLDMSYKKDADQFNAQLREKIQEENLQLENLYNADESGCEWRVLQDASLASFSEISGTGIKDNKERFTALFCSNASGTHKVSLLIIGQSDEPKCIDSTKYLSTVYRHSQKAYMDQSIFLDWYENVFIKNVMEYQEQTGTTGKVVLILDNAPSHPSAKSLNSINPNFEVMFLPPNVTALIQPQVQGIIATTKRLYKKALLRKLLLEKDCAHVNIFLKNFDLMDAIQILSNAWSTLEKTTLRNAWKTVLGDFVEVDTENFFENQNCVENKNECEIKTENFVTNENDFETPHSFYISEEFSRFVTKDNEECSENLQEQTMQMEIAVREWLSREDCGDFGWEPLSDSEIIMSVMNDTDFDTMPSIKLVNSSERPKQNDKPQANIVESLQSVSHEEANECARKLEIYMRNQEGYTKHDLQRIRKYVEMTAVLQYTPKIESIDCE